MKTMTAALPAIVLLLSATAVAAQEGSVWPAASAAAVGLDPAPLSALEQRIREGGFGHVDRMVVIRDGQLVVNARFPNDYREISRGRSSPIGCGTDACAAPSDVHQFNYFHPDYHPWWQGRDIHTLQSVTKSVAATVVGVAIARGEIAGVDTPLLSWFGAYDLTGVDPRLRTATLADLLTMRSGIEWHEGDRPLDDTNTTVQLEKSADWIRFTLAQPMDAAPGEKWTYNSGGSALIAEIVRAATGRHIDEYAREHLFAPLGIRDFHWKKTPTGHPDTEGGLYLEALDLARIGQLYLDDGVWRGQRILAPGWARRATARIVERTNPANANSPGYGWQWWRFDRRGNEVWAGNGFGGQFLVILPQQHIVGVINSWNVFGSPSPGVLVPFINALLDAAGVPAGGARGPTAG